MIKNIIMLIVLSVAAIFFQEQLVHLLKIFMTVHREIVKGLSLVFSVSAAGTFVQSVLALLLVPVLVGVLIGVAYYFIRQRHFSYTMVLIWILWALSLAAILSQGHVTNPTISNVTSQVTSAVSNVSIPTDENKP